MWWKNNENYQVGIIQNKHIVNVMKINGHLRKKRVNIFKTLNALGENFFCVG